MRIDQSQCLISPSSDSPNLDETVQTRGIKRRVQILSIDGGGVKGLIPLRIIMEIVKRTQFPIHELFDGFAGTSAGSLLLNALLIPGDKQGAKYTPEDLWDLVDLEFPLIFKRSYWKQIKSGFGIFQPLYSSRTLEKSIKKIMGEALFKNQLKDILVPAFNMHTFEPMVFTRHQARTEMEKSALKVSDVVLSSSSAPTFFSPFKLNEERFIDGGTFANNPSILAYCQGRELLGNESDIHMLSIGCGAVNYADEFKRFIDGGKLKWFPRLVEIFLSGTEKISNHIATKLLNKNYERIEVPIKLAHNRLDDASKSNLSYLKSSAEQWIAMNESYLDRLCKDLIVGRQLITTADIDTFSNNLQ
jgi:uncharacterized protein